VANLNDIKNKMSQKKVAIAGLGGLGSNIAVMLARTGIGELLLIDFDVITESNLNRQHYNLSHLGVKKTIALKEQIEKINPKVKVITKDLKITKENVKEIFKNYDIVCEAFDTPEDKAMLVNMLLEDGKTKIISASGISGYNDANKIKTTQKFNNLYICGDPDINDDNNSNFLAPRVTICAGHQANMALKLLLE